MFFTESLILRSYRFVLVFLFLIGISPFSFSKSFLLTRSHGTKAFCSCFLIINMILQRVLGFIFDVFFFDYKLEQIQK